MPLKDHDRQEAAVQKPQQSKIQRPAPRKKWGPTGYKLGPISPLVGVKSLQL